MSKKEKIKKYWEENRYKIVFEGVAAIILGAYGAFCLDTGARIALKDMAKVFTAMSGMDDDPTIYEVTGNCFKGFNIIPKT